MDEMEKRQKLRLTAQLFGYEADGGRNSIFWDRERLRFFRPGGEAVILLDQSREEWRSTKRPFTKDEVVTGKWIKVSDVGTAQEVILHPDGTLTENSLFDLEKKDTWGGKWEVTNGALVIYIGSYYMEVYASKDGDIHSGVEIKDGARDPDAYFKVIHVS